MPVIRIPVVVVGVLAVLAVGGVLFWGGGDTPEAASASGAPGFASAGGDSASASAAPGVPGGAGAAQVLPPFSPSDAAPAGGTSVEPTELDALQAWRVAGEWGAQLDAYQADFPMDGYRLGEQRITSSNGGGAWDIEPEEPDASGYFPDIGLLYIHPAPDDPGATIVEISRY